MVASAIRELATARVSTLVAAARFEETIQIWDSMSLKMICEFPTVFRMGAETLALSPLGDKLATGLSRNHGKVATYDVLNGSTIWERSLIFPNSLYFDPSGESLICTSNNQSVLRLDTHTGKVIGVVKRVNKYIEEPSSNHFVLSVKSGNSPIWIIGGGHHFTFNKTGFAVLDAQFSPHSVCVSEARGLVRCINLIDGTVRWKFDPGKDSHVVRLHYSSRIDAFFGILWDFERGGPRQLLRFDPASGIYERVCVFYSWAEAFVNASDQLVTSTGEIRSLIDGALVGRLTFPQMEYPDP